MALTQVPIELSSTPGIVDNSNATAITIDSSENVLVGTTDAAPGVGNTNTGGAFGSNGYGVFSRTGAAAQATAYFNKNTNDGTIIALNKDGTTVGSIGVEASDNFYIADSATNTGLNFKGFINPCDSSGASSRDNFDLGHSTQGRLRDIYLGGGVYLGGTGTANKLDDYEEGTWTPALVQTGNSVTHSAQSGIFVKVGRSVFISGFVSWSAYTNGTGSIEIDGMPFNVTNAAAAYSQIASFDHGGIPYTSGRTTFGLYAAINTDKARLLVAGSSLNTAAVSSISSVGFIYFSGTFYTDS